MQDSGSLDKVLRQLLLPQAGIPAALQMEGKVPLPSGKQLHEGQSGGAFRVPDQSPAVHSLPLQRLLQEAPVEVRPHLADEGGPQSQPGGGHRRVGRGAAGVPLVQDHARRRDPRRGKVDQQLPQADQLRIHSTASRSPARVRYLAQKGLSDPLSYTCRLQRCSRSRFRFMAS